MATSPTATLSPPSETSKPKGTETNGSAFVSILARSFGFSYESRNPWAFDDMVGGSLALAFVRMNDADCALTLEFINAAPKIAERFGYHLQQEVIDIDGAREHIIDILRGSRYRKLVEQVPQEISDKVRKEIADLREGNENVKRGMAEGRRDMYRDSFS
jgi:hypothetical protein